MLICTCTGVVSGRVKSAEPAASSAAEMGQGGMSMDTGSLMTGMVKMQGVPQTAQSILKETRLSTLAVALILAVPSRSPMPAVFHVTVGWLHGGRVSPVSVKRWTSRC